MTTQPTISSALKSQAKFIRGGISAGGRMVWFKTRAARLNFMRKQYNCTDNQILIANDNRHLTFNN